MAIFIQAKKGEIAEKAVVCGDPERVEALASLLSNAKVVNRNRGFLVYTGKYNGKGVTIATHGIGQPSAAIVIEELAELGAKEIVRFGTCGGLDPSLNVGDIVLVTGSSYNIGSTIAQYVGNLSEIALAQTPDFDLTRKLTDMLEKMKMKFIFTNAYSSDSFYSLKDERAKELSKYGNSIVEMETATLFMLGKAKGFKAAALLVVSDNVIKHTKLYTHKELQDKVMIAGKAVLEALTK